MRIITTFEMVNDGTGFLKATDKDCPIKKHCARIRKDILFFEEQCEYFTEANNGNCICLYKRP